MKKFSTFFIFGITSLFLLSGCTIAKISGHGPLPLLLNQPTGKVRVIKNINVSKMVVFDYTGSYDVSEIIMDEFEKIDADAIINITIVLKNTVADFFVNLITLGLAQARTVEIQGQAVRIEQMGALQGKVLQEAHSYSQLDPQLLMTPNAAVIKAKNAEGQTIYRVVQLQ